MMKNRKIEENEEFDLGFDPDCRNDEEEHRIIHWIAGDKICSGYFDEKRKLHRTDGTVEPQGFIGKTKEFFKNVMHDLGIRSRRRK